MGVHAAGAPFTPAAPLTAAFKSDSASADVDPPRDLTATNIQIESATLTWKPPQAAVTGYMLSFSSADAVIRVRQKKHCRRGNWDLTLD